MTTADMTEVPRYRSKAEAGRKHLERMQEEKFAEAASSLLIPDEVIKSWLAKQVGWWGQHAQKLKAVIDQNRREHGPTAFVVIHQEVRLENAVETIDLLRKKQHPLVCPTDGIQGVSLSELSEGWPEMDDLPFRDHFYQPLADRGMLEGDPTGWERRCEKCLKPLLEAAARRRYDQLVDAQND